MKCDWDGVKRLGAYLGCDIDNALMECPGSLDIICKSLGAFDNKYPREACARLDRLIFKTDSLEASPGRRTRRDACPGGL